MNYMNERAKLIEQGHTLEEAEMILDEELEFERISQRDREIEDEWDRREKEKQK